MTDTTKLHIIYCVLLGGVGLIAIHFFYKPPAVVTKTLTKVEHQVQTITKDRIVYKDRYIVDKKKNGDVITETIHEHSATSTDTATKTDTKTTEQTVSKDPFTKYSLGYSFSPIYQGNIDPKPNIQNSRIEVGYRLWDTPISATGAVSDGGKTYSVGVRYDW